MRQKEQMLENIGTLSFVMVELALYLDTHPFDRRAMDYFNHYSRIKNQMVGEFSREYYPLSLSMAESNREWRWGMAPLPWEGECG